MLCRQALFIKHAKRSGFDGSPIKKVRTVQIKI